MVGVLVVAVILAACESTDTTSGGVDTSTTVAGTTTPVAPDPDIEAGFPETDSWEAEHPQPSDGVPLEFAISAYEGVEGETLEVYLDGELIVAGTVVHPEDPDEHLCPAGPYIVKLGPGIHEIELVAGSGESLIDGFELEERAMGNIIYEPGSDPAIRWELYTGQGYVCA